MLDSAFFPTEGKNVRSALKGLFVSLSIALIAMQGGFAVSAAEPETEKPSEARINGGESASPETMLMREIRVAEAVSSNPDRGGYIKVRLANGAVIDIPAKEKERVEERIAENKRNPPRDEVPGTCGKPWVWLTAKENAHPLKLTTGFEVDFPAVSYAWHVDVTGLWIEGDAEDYTSAGGLAARTRWEGSQESEYDYPAGDFTAKVDTLESFALLATGQVCWSGGPTEEGYLGSPDAPISQPLGIDGSETRDKEPGTPVPAERPSATRDLDPGATGSAPSTYTVFPNDTRKRITPTTDEWWRTVVYLEITTANG